MKYGLVPHHVIHKHTQSMELTSIYYGYYYHTNGSNFFFFACKYVVYNYVNICFYTKKKKKCISSGVVAISTCSGTWAGVNWLFLVNKVKMYVCMYVSLCCACMPSRPLTRQSKQVSLERPLEVPTPVTPVAARRSWYAPNKPR